MSKRDFGKEAEKAGQKDSSKSRSSGGYSVLGRNYNPPSGREKEYSRGWNQKKK